MMWPFKKGWSKKQKKHRRLCRLEEQAVERLINWGATSAPPSPQEAPVGPSEQPERYCCEQGQWCMHAGVPPCVAHGNFSQKELDKDSKV